MTVVHAPSTSSGSAVVAGARSVTASVLAGGVSGVLVGGGLGRLAMRVLALTSPEIAQGRLTDDNARVGEFTLTGSLSLALALGVVGAVLGSSYPLVRRILPASQAGRIAGFALLTGVLGGALLVHDHPSFDYTVLQPAWLAVAMFVVVPACWGALTAVLADLLSPAPRTTGRGRWSRAWHSDLVTTVGRVTYAVLVAWGLYGIGTDVWSLATDHASAVPFSL